MNYIKHLTGFYNKIIYDNRLNPTHVSLYLALFQFWNLNRFQNPISVSRNELMKLCKISAYATYHKCIKELHDFAYIRYMPSFNPYKGSLVYLFDFDMSKKKTSAEELIDNKPTKNKIASSQALVPSINTINNSKHKTYSTSNSDLDIKENFILKNGEKASEKESSKGFVAPSLSDVSLYFEEKNANTIEAEKFFNHYESNGWLVGGKSKMKNWQAAARNWLLNAKKFNVMPNQKDLKINNLNATTQKTYTDPL